MAMKVLHKRSTSGNLPTGDTLLQGEIAVNYSSADPFLSIRKEDGSYVRISSDEKWNEAVANVDKRFDDYLPKSGGTIDGNLNIGKETNDSWKYIRFNRLNSSGVNTSGFLGNGGLKMEMGMDEGYIQVGKNLLDFISDAKRYYILHTGNYSDHVLPLSGGTITNKEWGGQLTLKRPNGTPSLYFDDDTYKYYLYPERSSSDNKWWLGNNMSENLYHYIIHSGNIGSQSVNYATSAGSATKLQNTKKIWGIDFDGTSNITHLHPPKSAYYYFSTDGSNYVGYIGKAGGASRLYFDAVEGYDISINANDTYGQGLLLTTNNNLLLGTMTDAGAKLQVNGNILLGEGGVDMSIGTAYGSDDKTPFNQILIGNATTGIKYRSGGWTSSVNNISHEFCVGSNNSISALAIKNGGNVGIGTTSPTYKLDVAGIIRTTNRLLTGENGDTGIWRGSLFSGSLAINDIAIHGEEKIILWKGNVGVGTLNPQYNLDVNGTFNCNAFETNSIGECFWGGSTANYGMLTWASSGSASVRATSGNQLKLGIGTTDYINIATDGAVSMNSNVTIGGHLNLVTGFDLNGINMLVLDNSVATYGSVFYDNVFRGKSHNFNGSSINLENDCQIRIRDSSNTANRNVLTLTSGDVLRLGGGTRPAGFGTEICGYTTKFICGSNITSMIINENNNITISNRDIALNNFKLVVDGLIGMPNGDTVAGILKVEDNKLYLGYSNVSYDTIVNGKNVHLQSSLGHIGVSVIANGNVGIGNTDPQYKLDVNGWVSANFVKANGLNIASAGESYCGLMQNKMITSGGKDTDIWLYNNSLITIHGGEGVVIDNSTTIRSSLTVGNNGANSWLPIYLVRNGKTGFIGLEPSGKVSIGSGNGILYVSETNATFSNTNGEYEILHAGNHSHDGFLTSITKTMVTTALGYTPMSTAGGTFTGGVTGTSFSATTSISAATGFFQTSDETLKDFYDEIDVDFEKLKKIPKRYYKWKSDPNGDLEIGTSAQKVQEIYPELVGKGEKLSVDYSKLSVIALKAVDKLYEENERLRKENEELRREMNEKFEMIMKMIKS